MAGGKLVVLKKVLDRLASVAHRRLPPALSRLLQRTYHRFLELRRVPDKPFSIMSCPPFPDQASLSMHLKKLHWYLGDVLPAKICKVYVYHESLSDKELAEVAEDAFKGAGNPNNLEFVFIDRNLSPSERPEQVDLILEWRSDGQAFLRKEMRNHKGIRKSRITNVDPLEPGTREYAVFANMAWAELWDGKAKDAVRSRSHELLAKLIRDLKKKSARALVFATGPSFSQYKSMRREGTVIACNSIVESRDFFVSMKPNFFVFGDAAHHVGPSKRARRFRELLKARLEEFPSFYVVTTDRFAPVILREFKDFESRFIFLEQSSKRAPNFRLDVDKFLPAMHSVGVIHMLPLAGSIANEIFLVGFDGDLRKSPKDDFWAHDEELDYSLDLEEFYEMHPSYAWDRQQRDVHNAYNEDFNTSLTYGESVFGKKFIPVAPSAIPAIQERFQASVNQNVTGH